MPPRPAPLPDHLGAAFAVAAHGADGISRSRSRARDLLAPHRGVRMRAAPPAPPDTGPLARDRATRAAVLRRVQAYEIARRPHAFYTGRTAIAIYDRLFDGHDGHAPLEVAVLDPARAPRCAGVRGIRLTPSLVEVREVDGLPVASPASVWAGMAGELSLRGLVRLGDALVRIPRTTGGVPARWLQLTTPDELRAAADAPRRRGRRLLDLALARIRIGSMSTLETDFRVGLFEAELPEPDLDVEIRDGRGVLLGIADAAYLGQRLIVEVEGEHHLHDVAQWNRDIEKHAALVAQGWEVLRLTARHIRGRPPRAPAMVADALRRRGWSG